jgi:NAD(P)-dependent dehydrogenase (short-subunit alcohol dehydrogenase family)
MATGFAEAEAKVIISSRHENELRAAADQIVSATGSQAAWVVADMVKRDEVRRLADEATKKFGRIDIVVNNAGTNNPQLIDQVRDEDWDRLIELNLTSCMALTRALVPQMKERRWGRIIHISSIIGIAGKEGRNAYGATKAALVGMARSTALDIGAYGITCNCIAPGPFLTDLTRGMLSEEQKQAFATRTALGRWGEPPELAGAALLLASDAGSYITGQMIVVDGGLLCKTF